MAVALPQSTDKLNSPDHAKLHRVIAVDTDLSDSTVVVDTSGITYSGSGNMIVPATVSYQIGTISLGSDEWGYLDGLNQALKTTDSPTFNDLTIDGTATIAEQLLVGATSTSYDDPAVLIGRSVDGTAGGSSHGFVDDTEIDSGYSYAAFDVQFDISGTKDYSDKHFNGFQSNGVYSGSSDVLKWYGHTAKPTNNGAGDINNYYGYYAFNPLGTGTYTSAYGVYIEVFSKASTNNYQLFCAGTTGKSYVGGSLMINQTGTPAGRLEIGSLGGGQKAIVVKNSSDAEIFTVWDDATGDGQLYLANSTPTTKIVLNTNGTSYFDGGNVAIGATSSAELFYVSGGNILLDNNTDLRIKTAGGTATQVLSVSTGDNVQFGNTAFDDIEFYVGTLGVALTLADATGNATFTADAKAVSFSIGANTLTTSEWANLDGLNQTLATTSSPTFSFLSVTNILYLNGETVCSTGSVAMMVDNDNSHYLIFATSGGIASLLPSDDSTHTIGATNYVYAEGWFDAIKSDGDITIIPSGADVLIDGGLTVGSTTQAGDNNLRIEGTSALVGNVTCSGDIAVNGGTITSTTSIVLEPATLTVKIDGKLGVNTDPTTLIALNTAISTTSLVANQRVQKNTFTLTGSGDFYGTGDAMNLIANATSTSAKNYGTLRGLTISVSDDATAACTSYGIYGMHITVDSDHSSVYSYGVASYSTGLGVNKSLIGNASGGTENWAFYTDAGDARFLTTYLDDGSSLYLRSSDEAEYIQQYHNGTDGLILTGGTNAGGLIQTAPVVAPTLTGNSQISWYLDEGGGNLVATIKESDGDARTVTIAFD